jgi:crotonobetainyl-CoA hydratase
MTDRAVRPPSLLAEQRGHVVILTLNRPEARNAVNLDLAQRLGDALDHADHDADIWAVVVTGAGDTAFCAGADLKAVSRGESVVPSDPRRAGWGFAGYVSHPISKPTIAAVNGFALGGGTEITLASDLAVAAESASFGQPEVARGIIAGAGGAFRLAQQLPRKVAMEMLLTGAPVTARQALELGLINRVVPAGQLLDAALELAARICSNAPLAVQATKRIALGIADGRIAADDAGWELTEREARAVMRSQDAQEGPSAFAEKRPPVWTGR